MTTGYNQLKAFVYDVIVDYYTLAPSGLLKVGIYSAMPQGATFIVELGDYSGNYTSAAFKDRIIDAEHLGGQTNLENALDSVTNDIALRGELSRANTAILVITDGQTNIGNNGKTAFTEAKQAGFMPFAVLVVPPNGYYSDERAAIQEVLPNDEQSVIAPSYAQIQGYSNQTMTNSEWVVNAMCNS